MPTIQVQMSPPGTVDFYREVKQRMAIVLGGQQMQAPMHYFYSVQLCYGIVPPTVLLGEALLCSGRYNMANAVTELRNNRIRITHCWYRPRNLDPLEGWARAKVLSGELLLGAFNALPLDEAYHAPAFTVPRGVSGMECWAAFVQEIYGTRAVTPGDVSTLPPNGGLPLSGGNDTPDA